MSDVLSQQEIDELLRALNSGEVDVEGIQEQTQEKKVRVYDFRRPNKFAKDQLRTMQIIYENFCRLMSSYLSGTLRAYCQANVVSVEPLTYYEFNNSLPDPVMLGIVGFKPLEGSIMVTMSPSIAFAIVDKLLGGPGETMDKVRDFTEIEISLIGKILKELLKMMSDAWANVLKANFFLERVETNAQFAQIISPNETIALITLNILIGDIEGMMNICIPHIVIEPIINQLSTKFWFSSKTAASHDTNNAKSSVVTRRIANTQLTLKAILGQTCITVRDFIELQPGDIIKLNRKMNEDAEVFVENIKKFDGIIGTQDNNLAVQITGIERGELNDNE
ncbi:flagellar motor switch protein FliM [Xylanivirga thermophila]|uniref:flagellar motor switch protein FliM n=1 Tax=Xylanivirga thermophila TaxID=2496273 RepID=UPI00101BF900|nr:flagellar motor switch protein FliM [Xylanivirga thermophila]